MRRCAPITVALLLALAPGASAVPKLKTLQSLAAPRAVITAGPVAAADREGRVVVLWAQGVTLVQAVKPSAGRPFGAASEVGVAGGLVSDIAIVSDLDGTMVAAWRAGEAVLASLRAPGPATSFGPPQRLADAGMSPRVAVNAGTAAVSWGSPSGPFAAIRLSGEAAFGAPAQLSGSGGVPDVAVDPDGLVLAAWPDGPVRVAASDRGTPFAAPGAAGGSDVSAVDLLMSPTGDTHAVFGEGTLLYDTFRVRGRSNGFKNATTLGTGSLGAAVVDHTGNTLVVWQNGEGLAGSFARSGEPFGGPFTIVARDGGPPVAAAGSDAFAVAWARPDGVRVALRRRGTDAPFAAPVMLASRRPAASVAVALDLAGAGVVAWRAGSAQVLAALDQRGGDRVAPRVAVLGRNRYACDERCTLRRGRGRRVVAAPGQVVVVRGRGALVARDRYGNARRVRMA